MRVGVVDSVEDRVMSQKRLIAVHVYRHRQHQQQKGNGQGESPPGRRAIAELSGFESARTTRDKEKQDSHGAGGDRKRQQPVVDELPCRQGEQEEAKWFAEDGIGGATYG